MPEEYSAPLSPEQLDILLGDLSFDEAAPVNASPDPAVGKVSPVSKNPIPSFCKSGGDPIPSFWNGPETSASPLLSPKSEKTGGAHHGPDIDLDANVIRLLHRLYPDHFELDPRYHRSPLKARKLPVARDTQALLSKTNGARSDPKYDASNKTKAGNEEGGKARKGKGASQRRLPRWEDMTPELRGVWLTLWMRRTLPARLAALGTVEEAGFGIPCSAFTLNLSTAYEAQLRRDFEAAKGNPKREHPSLTLRRRIERNVKAVVGRDVQVCVVTELDPGGRLHAHGIIDLTPGDAGFDRNTGKMKARNPVTDALRRAGGKWEHNSQHQADIVPSATPGWLLYDTKRLADELEGMSITQWARKRSREAYDKWREKVSEAQDRMKARGILSQN